MLLRKPKRPRVLRPTFGHSAVAARASRYPQDMRQTIKAFGQLMAASAVGVYAGMVACGLLALVRGDVFAVGGEFFAGLPLIALLGAGGGVWVARRVSATRRGMFATVGALTLPIALMAAHLQVPAETVGAIVLLPGAATAAAHLSGERRRTRRTRVVH